MAAPGGCGYVVPTWQLGDELRRHRVRLASEFTSVDSKQQTTTSINRDKEDDGWLVLIAMRMTRFNTTTTLTSNRRWLYRVLHRESLKADANMADAALLACDVWMDHHTEIQTFPDTRVAAAVMVTEEAAALDVDLTRAEIKMLAQWKLDERDRVLWAKGVTESYTYHNGLRVERYRNSKAQKERKAA